MLAAQWRSDVGQRHSDQVSENVLGWTMVYLFFITGIPFSTSVVGLHGNVPPAVWLYAANMIIVGAVSLRLRLSEVAAEHRLRARIGAIRTLFFMATALASILISPVEPGYAMYAYMLNIPGGPVSERMYKFEAASSPRAD